MKSVISLLLVIGTFSPGTSQQEMEPRKNSIHLIPGTGVFWVTGTLAYERRLQKRTFLRAGAGIVEGNDSGQHLFVQYGFILGAKNHHFEISVGPALIISDLRSIPFSGAAGYRFQKPDGWFVFKAGAAWPEMYFLSFGVAF